MRLLIFTLSVGFFIWLPSAFADSGGGLSVDAPAHLRQVQNSDNALLTLTVKNIQVHADWHVTSDGDVFTIDNDGVLRRSVLVTGTHVAKIYAVDRFDRLNPNYANLTASAVITVEFVLGTEFYFANAPSQLVALARLPEAVALYQFTATNGVEAYTYNLVGGNDAGYFSLDAASGVLSLPSNSEMRGGPYNLRVGVSDGVNQATAVVRVRIVPNQFFVMGGFIGFNSYAKDVWASLDSKNWSPAGDANWSGRLSGRAVSHNGRIYVLGGYDGSFRNDVWSSVNGANWSFEGNASWGARYFHQAVSHNGRIYVLGGNASGFKNDVWSSADGANWSFEGNADWTARQSHRAVSHNGRLYVLGGAVGSSSFRNDVWSSVDGANWSFEGNAGWGEREAFMAVSHKGRLYMMGGKATGNNSRNDVWSSLNGKDWSQELANGSNFWGARFYSKSLSHRGLLYVLGGFFSNGGINDVWSSADGKSWTEVTAASSWSIRYGHMAVVFPPSLVLSGTSEVIILSEGTAKTGIATVTAQNGLGAYTYLLESGSGSGIYLNNSSSGVLSYNGNGSKGEYLVTVRVEDEDKLQAETIIRVKIE